MADVKKQLIQLISDLDEKKIESLLDYAEFLHQKIHLPETKSQTTAKLAPLDQTRPDSETVVKAIKRLRAIYFMIDTDNMLNETSSLMTQHILQGRDAVEVIDELDALFYQQYQDYLKS